MVMTRMRNISSQSNEQLFKFFILTRERDAMAELYNRHRHLVFGVCLKYLRNVEEAKDATISLFEKLIAMSTDPGVRDFQPWLYVVVRNHCLLLLRERNRQDCVARHLKEDVLTEDIQEGDDSECLIDQLEGVLSGLPEVQHRCVKLFYFRKLSYREIVDLTGMTEREVKTNLQNARRNLRLAFLK